MAESHSFGRVITLTEEDIETIMDNGVVEVGNTKITHYDNATEDVYAEIYMSNSHLEKIRDHKCITYEIMNLDDVCEEVYVRRGTVADYIG